MHQKVGEALENVRAGIASGEVSLRDPIRSVRAATQLVGCSESYFKSSIHDRFVGLFKDDSFAVSVSDLVLHLETLANPEGTLKAFNRQLASTHRHAEAALQDQAARSEVALQDQAARLDAEYTAERTVANDNQTRERVLEDLRRQLADAEAQVVRAQNQRDEALALVASLKKSLKKSLVEREVLLEETIDAQIRILRA
ncbi:MAG: hypothetical protein GY882_10520 [Actinomycetia bacterium]|nr:hypothetical protein [Actinomycetes bacterium]MCP4845524.1 hypothetical protein [Actinomycetes bacterium]